jgi:hypothetical protein
MNGKFSSSIVVMPWHGHAETSLQRGHNQGVSAFLPT